MLILATGLVFASCSGEQSRTVRDPGAEALDSVVPAEAIGATSTSLDFLVQRCGDIITEGDAVAVLTEASAEAGLGPDDDRWPRAARSIVDGVSQSAPGAPCRPTLARWLSVGLVPDTIPVAPSTSTSTTTPLDVELRELVVDKVPLSSPSDFARLAPGQTLDEVRVILGSDGKLEEESTVGIHHNQLFRWPAEGEFFASILVQFRDGWSVAATRSESR